MTGAAGTALLFAIHGPELAWLGALCMFLCGLGMGASVTTFFATVADLFHGKHYGSIMGFVTFGFSLGGAFSPWFVGHLNDVTGSYSIALGMVLIALVIAAVLVLAAAPRKLSPVPGVQRRFASAPKVGS
jgi:MFS family permease